MPKSKKKESKKKSEEVVINLDNIGTPIAILISGIIIAVVIFFASKNNTPTTTDTAEESTVDTTVESTGEGIGEFEAAATTFGDVPVLGDRDTAKVAIVEHSEFRCSYCMRHLDETFPSILENYIDTGDVIYVYKEFAMYGDDIANAAKCVYHLGGVDMYKEFHVNAFNLEDDDAIYALAKEVGVNESDFDACYSSSQYQDEIDADKQAGADAGIQGTPGFVVGTFDEDGNVDGVLIPGAYPYDSFVEVIESYL
ncbi:MAG: DsbA oxidoreductase [candidate division WS6 bacterium 34_10]|uniref:DsbA oxidoreductase n=1 Tax=candidate division WS6 bacterium 34_10 TaxID=1641389 RepID=A0A117M0R8_9BACT|nr:MAG: DsbA oxidoreductase [candidate division WS6 bacterium 34_10]